MTAAQVLERPDPARAGSAGQGPASAGDHDDSPASAARTGPVHVHLTPFAPGCEKLGMASPRRNATFYGKTLSQVLRATLKRLQLTPADVTVEAEVNGDVNLLAAVPPELVRLQSSEPGVPVPFAIIWAGAEAPALAKALDALRAAGWTPFPKPIFDPGSYS